MSGDWTRCESRLAHGSVVAFVRTCLAAIFVCLMGVASAGAQVAAPVRESDSIVRLLSLEEGRTIVNVAWQQEPHEAGIRDCSHVVHQIYANAGFEYAYASSFEIYAGNENFERVKNAHPGDLIAWPGHVGIVVDPLQHRFYSLVRTGLQAQNYQSAYWRSRGRPRFYRYKVGSGGVVSASNAAGLSRVSNRQGHGSANTAAEERTPAEYDSSNRPPSAASEKAEVLYGPPSPPVSPVTRNAETTFAIPASVIIATGNKAPTREEVAEGISELSDAYGGVLKTEDPLKIATPVVVVEKFSVERVDIKRDHGWARLVVDSRALIGGGAVQVKRRREKVRWELRRTESGWEAVTPADRTYVPRDVAVKNLAASLARLTNSDSNAKDQQAVLRQEAQLASLLNALLGNK